VLARSAQRRGGGTLKGFEVAYQTFFDFLPGLLSGFGVQGNYTYVKQSGISNSNLANGRARYRRRRRVRRGSRRLRRPRR
jgi:hypothetical protein